MFPREFTFNGGITLLESGGIVIANFGFNPVIVDPNNMVAREVNILPHITKGRFVPTVIYEDIENTIWFGTRNNGIFLYNPTSKQISRIEGLECNDISSIIEDMQGNVWIGTLYGLSKYDRSTGNITTYYAVDGTGGNQFNNNALILSNDELVFGGSHGLTIFNPTEVGDKQAVKLYINGLSIGNNLLYPSSDSPISRRMELLNGTKLRYDQNNITLFFSAIDYSNSPRVDYHYKMEGYDKQWTDNYHNIYAFDVTIGRAPWNSVPAYSETII